MRKITILTAIFIFFIAAHLFAEGSIEAQVSKTSLTTDEAFTYKITITVFGNELPETKLSKFEGFKILSSMQSSTMSFAKNTVKKTIIYKFLLRPKNVGKLKIEPSSVKIEKETFFSDSFEIEVKP